MSESTGSTVECPVCGEDFDPTAAGGWCTNSECGEWRHDGDVGDQSEERGDVTGESGADAPTDDAPDDSADAWESADDLVGGDATDDDGGEDDGGEDDGGDHGDVGGLGPSDPSVEEDVEEFDETVDDTVDEPEPDGTDEEGTPGTDERTDDDQTSDDDHTSDERESKLGDVEGDRAADDDAAGEEPTEITCPDCETTLEVDASFCPGCGADVSAVEPGADGDESPELTECPGCGADVSPEDSFCASCGEDLDAHRGADELTECPACGDEVDGDDSFCASCGEDLDAHRTGDAAAGGEDADDRPPSAGSEETAPESLALSVRGEELAVADGDTVGRDLRRIITETGGDEDDAVRVHREHVRFVRDDGQFHLVALGRNPTRVNDRRLEQGEREPVEPGDEIELSDVVTLAVREP